MTTSAQQHVLQREELPALLGALRDDGYLLVGPTVRDGAIVLDEIAGVADLPEGWTEDQEAGTYRLRRRDDLALFGFAAGPQSFKQRFFVPKATLWRARRSEGGFSLLHDVAPPPRLALIGARSCDIHAIEIQDRTFLRGPFADPDYEARRRDVFVVAVNCGTAGGTCFCVSMGTGPKASFGFDLALTELLDDGGHRFLVEVGSERGAALLERLAPVQASAADEAAAAAVVERTARSMGRRMETEGIKELLYRNLEHPRWDDVADRCLACTNCTLVCPTCFCARVEDTTDLTGETAERTRHWDSCFTLGHSKLHGAAVRATHKARYRQWLVHKVASWIDQFGTSGCVGCGRCITWCPVAIDITEEVAAIRATDGAVA
ncbi:4Fe-4S dicluster domain-containing protein [Vulgatibacter sp.]|uniref:4Fe-4S dicluster domain-containing protein n=1 Tax=Vulgatibacter sp. TaxID=1971226 RepID=UPI003562F8E6